jgi:hypothetical protein
MAGQAYAAWQLKWLSVCGAGDFVIIAARGTGKFNEHSRLTRRIPRVRRAPPSNSRAGAIATSLITSSVSNTSLNFSEDKRQEGCRVCL